MVRYESAPPRFRSIVDAGWRNAHMGTHDSAFAGLARVKRNGNTLRVDYSPR